MAGEVADRRRAITLPDGTAPVAVAAATNPGISSWVALRRRVVLRTGASVLVLDATGSAGRLAVQIAKHLGAAHVVTAGHDPERLHLLPGLGADETVSLPGEPKRSLERSRRSRAARRTDAPIGGPPSPLLLPGSKRAGSAVASPRRIRQVGPTARIPPAGVSGPPAAPPALSP
ncbi:hypothetical protein ABZY09_12285 [Streptomyces sp. NPDC002928]|uniref:hypothetical protein n=1 Tax=Streptomyces sp. NPDC002928 TaxID=3154440 RepID=UPI0033A55B71